MIDYDETKAENEKLHRFEINKPRPRHRHRYTKYKICHSTMIDSCIKKYPSNI